MSHHFIRYTDVHFSYPDGTEVLRGVTFSITHGEKVALLGLNGAGKSTLLLTVNGLLMPTSGTINIGGIPLGKHTLPTIRQSVGMVFQNADDQLFMPSVEEDVAFGPINMHLPPEEVERRVEEALRTVGMESLRKRLPSQLSGGQKRMVALATVLSMEPNIMVLDEPSASLDWKAREDLANVLRAYRHTCLLATHDIALAADICSRALVISEGKVTADLPMAELPGRPDILELIGITSKSAPWSSERAPYGGQD